MIRLQVKHRLTLLAFAAVISVSASPARANLWICQNLFESTPSTAYGALRTDFEHSKTYSNELSDQGEVLNQCSLGTCHLHSWVASLEHDHAHDQGPKIKLSMQYLTAKHWLARSLGLLSSLPAKTRANTKIELAMGAEIAVSRASILKYGLIPDEAWTARRNFYSDPIAGRITEYVKNIVARTRFEYERETDSEKLILIRKRGLAAIRDVFQNLVGDMPTDFEFRGERITPEDFAKKYYPELSQPIVKMHINRKTTDRTTVETEPATTIVNTSVSNVEKAAREAIDAGQNVYLAYHHNRSFVHAQSGVMSMGLFVHPKDGAPMSRASRDLYGLEEGGHAVQIVGYDLDPKTGRVLKWKIKNSWGTESGDGGYYHMYADYFRAYAKSIAFYRSTRIDLPPHEGAVVEKQLALPF